MKSGFEKIVRLAIVFLLYGNFRFAKTWKCDSVEVIDTVLRQWKLPFQFILDRASPVSGPRSALRSAEFKSLIHF